ncbi:phosphotransferase [Agrococcus sp. ARC_14]|uniref:phosphotransferase enzyme family protein n=1 Tax=Agrococcus sp. ARC_14 TaxID=2919927 RepID=UPI001F0568B3|nr:phosphotransferase [Agrococcus sp. ARC_14]MCH1882183.1 phosphotransferase [Agrococcus sp. ARC_14]
MASGYDDLTEAEQVEALRPVAMRAAEAFGLDVARLEVLLHAYNTTFELEQPDGRRFALRLGTNSHSTVEHAIAQQAWIAAIGEQTEVRVPEPLRTPDGRWCVEVAAPELGRSLLVTIAGWLDGDDADVLDIVSARALGRTMATLHAQADGWALPAGGSLPRFDEPLFGDEDLLAAAPGLSAGDRAVLDEARARADEVFERLFSDARLRPLHADLHGGNLKWHEGRLAVFDFDDAGLGLPALDLAISAFYLRGEDPALEAAMRAGYAELAPLPEVAHTDFETIVASRQLLLANALLASNTADLRAQAADYLRTSVQRIRHWLETGSFTRTPA